jgi:hypothetical protein
MLMTSPSEARQIGKTVTVTRSAPVSSVQVTRTRTTEGCQCGCGRRRCNCSQSSSAQQAQQQQAPQAAGTSVPVVSGTYDNTVAASAVRSDGGVKTKKVEYSGVDNGIMQVTGDELTLLRFHDIYQTKLWPDWREHKDDATLKREANAILLGAHQGNTFYDVRNKEVRAAFDYAVSIVNADK